MLKINLMEATFFDFGPLYKYFWYFFLQDIQECLGNEELEELNVTARNSLKHLKVKIEVYLLTIFLLHVSSKYLFLKVLKC